MFADPVVTGAEGGYDVSHLFAFKGGDVFLATSVAGPLSVKMLSW